MKGLINAICVLLLLVSCSSPGSNTALGPGVIHFEETSTRQLNFYNEPDSLTQPAFNASLYYQDSIKEIITSLIPLKDTLKFYPLYQLPKRNVLTLQVIEQRGDWYKVYTNEKVQTSHWVFIEGKSTENWFDFWPSVRRVTGVKSTNPLRKNPNPNAENYDINPDRLCLKVVEMQDIWLKVRNAPDRCPDSYVVQEEFEGFIRWKRNDEILVNFSL